MTRKLSFEKFEHRALCAVNVTTAGGTTTVTGGIESNTVRVSTTTNSQYLITAGSGQTWRVPQGNMVIKTGGGNDYITIDPSVLHKMTIDGGDGNDVIKLGGGNDVAFGGSGNDIIYGGNGNDTLYGGVGNDTIHGQNGHDVLNGGSGNDKIVGGLGNDQTNGEEGDDEIDNRDGNASINGDRNVNPEEADTVLRDPYQSVPATARVIDDLTNHVRFSGGNVTIRASAIQDIFNLTINGGSFGQWRDDVGRIAVHSYHLAVDAVISDGNFHWYQLG